MTVKELVNMESLKDIPIPDILSTIYEAVTKEASDDVMKDASKIMSDPVMNRYVSYLTRIANNDQELSESNQQDLFLLITIVQAIYNYSGYETGMSDSAYDKLYELLNKAGMEVITTPVTNGKKVPHRYVTLRGTLAKVYALTNEDVMANKSRRSLDQWIAEQERKIYELTGDQIDLNDEEIYVFPKWDGVSVIFEFDKDNKLERALTRGDTDRNLAQEITKIFKPVESEIAEEIPTGIKIPYGLKTEVMMKEKDLKDYNKKYGTDYRTTRSVISSIVNSDEVDDRIHLLDIVRLRTSILDENGVEGLQELSKNVFQRPYLVCKLKDREAIKEFANKHTNIDGLRCDGAVIYIQNRDIREMLGRKDHKNQYEVAYKFNEEEAYTKIKDIEFNITPYGKVFPVAIFEPVKMKGNTINRVTMGSIGICKKLHLAKGDTVKILYEIIPYLVFDEEDGGCKRSGKKPIPIPTICPMCGKPIEFNSTGSAARCINPDCKHKQLGKIHNYITKLKIDGFGEQTEMDLFTNGIITDIIDLYKLPKKEKKVVSMDGYSDVKYLNMLKGIKEGGIKLSTDRFLGAIGIENCGHKTFEKVLNEYSFKELLSFAEEHQYGKLASISGISDKTAVMILDGINSNRKLIDKLLEYVDVSYKNREKEALFYAVFHNTRSEEVASKLEDIGGYIQDNVTKKTNFMIVPEGTEDVIDPGSEKARKRGVTIVGIDKILDEANEFVHHIYE